jgi:hypothetical protein
MPPRQLAPLAAAKAECREALIGAKAADPVHGAMLDRLYVETIQATAGAPAAASCEMCGGSRESCSRYFRTAPGGRAG